MSPSPLLGGAPTWGSNADDHPEIEHLVTSQPYSEIYQGFRHIENKSSTVHLGGENGEESEKIAEEIGLVIKSSVQEISEQKELTGDEHEFLRTQLIRTPHRTYLWVSLMLEYIKETPGFTKGNVRRALGEDIPESVNQAYAKILDRSSDPQKARLILHIVLAARNPLSLEEISICLSLKNADHSEREIKLDIDSHICLTRRGNLYLEC